MKVVVREKRQENHHSTARISRRDVVVTAT
jgi:hypothetical protein